MKKSLWMRLLAMLLVFGLMMGCLVGCGDDAESEGDDDEKEDEKIEELRKGLKEYKYQGLLIYLGKDMSKPEYGYSSNDDESMQVSITVMDADTIEEEFGEGITSAKKLAAAAEAFFDDIESEEIVDSGKENGTYYLHGEAEDEQAIMGFYYEDGYGWIVTAIFNDDDLKDTAMKYATLCEVSSLPDLESEENEGEEEEMPGTQTNPTYSDPNEDYPGNTETPTPELEQVTLTVWVPDQDITSGWLEDRLDAFEALYEGEYEIHWNIDVCNEGSAGTMISADPEAAADVFLYTNDCIGTLVNCGALSPLGGSYRNQVLNDNSDTMIQSVTYTDGNIYGFPVTTNTWFMYYNKSWFSESDIQSLDTMLSKGKVAFDLSNGWYNGTFFFGAGATLFGANGNDASAGVDYGPLAGDVARKMVALYSTGNLVASSGWESTPLLAAGDVGACFSGSWDYESLYRALGDDLGVAALPTYTMNGQSYQMKAFAGSKAFGVNATISNPTEAKLAHDLAAFLANEESQELRFELRSITPAHVGLANSRAVRNNPVAMAEIEVTNNCSIVQPYIPAMMYYWSPMGNFGAAIVDGTMTMDNAEDLLDQTLDQING